MTVGMCSSRAIAADVQRPGAARRHQHEIARVVALLDRHFAHRERHFGNRDLDDARAAAIGSIVQRLGDLVGNAFARAVGVELHLAAEEILRAEPPEHDVGVGDGRLGAAAGGSRSGPDRRRRCAGRPSARRHRRSRRCCRRRRRLRRRRRPAASPDGRWRSRRRSSPRAIVGSPSRTRLVFAVVPPMSKEMTLPIAERFRRSRAEAMMPPTGPDSIIATGRRIAARGRHHAAIRLHDRRARRGSRAPASRDCRFCT